MPNKFVISEHLRNLRYQVLRTDPARFPVADDPQIGRELNEWRSLLARLVNVHAPTNTVSDWGPLLQHLPPAPLPAQAGGLGQAAEDDEIEVPEGEGVEDTDDAAGRGGRQGEVASRPARSRVSKSASSSK